MISSRKRKLIKIISLSAASIVMAGSATFGIVYSNTISNNTSRLIERSNKVELDANTADNSQYNSNRDFNTPKQPKPEENQLRLFRQKENLIQHQSQNLNQHQHQHQSLNQHLPQFPSHQEFLMLKPTTILIHQLQLYHMIQVYKQFWRQGWCYNSRL